MKKKLAQLWLLAVASKKRSRPIFSEEDCSATLFKEWGAFRDAPFAYKKGETWDRMVHQCVHLLERFAQENRIRDGPAGLLSLDPQLICYSWATHISDVALVVFVRKHQPEIQYLKTSISEEQHTEFARLLETTIGQIEGAQFPSDSGIRFPQNGCVNCPHLGLCLDNQTLIEGNLIHTSGVNDLAWLDELVD